MTKNPHQILLQSLIGKLGSDILTIDHEGQILIWEQGFGGQRDNSNVGKNLRELFPQPFQR